MLTFLLSKNVQFNVNKILVRFVSCNIRYFDYDILFTEYTY